MVTEAIRCENLSKHFGKLVALDDLSLTVHGVCSGGRSYEGRRLLAGLTATKLQ